jgi:hypothetical protein
MVSRRHILCLSLSILSIVMACTVTPPPMAPLRATLAPAAPAAMAPPVSPGDGPPVVLPAPPLHPPYSAGGRTSDLYQSSPSEGAIDYERKMDEKSATTGNGAVPRSRHRSSALSSGSKSEPGSGIRAMNGGGDLFSRR